MRSHGSTSVAGVETTLTSAWARPSLELRFGSLAPAGLDRLANGASVPAIESLGGPGPSVSAAIWQPLASRITTPASLASDIAREGNRSLTARFGSLRSGWSPHRSH